MTFTANYASRKMKISVVVFCHLLIAGFSESADNSNLRLFLSNLESKDQETWSLIQDPLANLLNATNGKNLLRRAIVPNYLEEFLNLLKVDTRDAWDTLICQLFEGVTSPECIGHLLEWTMRMVNQTNGETRLTSDKDKWVLQMADAWGKLPEGILSGHVGAFGDFYECIEMEVSNLTLYNKKYPSVSKSFEGLYCTSYILDYATAMAAAGRPMGQESTAGNIGVRKAVSVEELIKLMLEVKTLIIMVPSLSTCMPNSCSLADVQNILVNSLNLTYSLMEVFSGIPPESLPWLVTAKCQEAKQPDFDAPVIVVIIIISAIVAVSLAAGILDYWQNHDVENPQQRAVIYEYFMAFSVYRNIKMWLSTRKSPDDMGCIHGIRFFSTCWVVLGHTYTIFQLAPRWNIVNMKQMYEQWTILAIMSGHFSVDTFFVMSGTLATYGIMKALDKTKGNLNIPMLYIHRYLRLTPTYAILVGIGATLVRYASNGPGWDFVDWAEQNCRKYWWTNILYVNNLFHMEEMCNAESWYLANDMQFFLLTPFIVYPIWRWKKLGLICLSGYTVLSWLSTFLVAYITDGPSPPRHTGTMENKEYINEIYMRPWSRIQSYIPGIWLGWVLYQTRGKSIKLPKLASAGLWLISTGVALALLYGMYPYFNPENKIPQVNQVLFAAWGRFAWAVAIAIVIFCCVKGYGGIVDKFLSWQIFMPLGRLSFCVYLISVHLQYVYYARLTTPIRYDTYLMTNLFFSHLLMSYIAAFICSLLFESPFITLQKLIFTEGTKPKPEAQESSQDSR